METVVIKIASQLLRHHGISFAFVGELALNYYNVPRVLHDVGICVPSKQLQTAADMLKSTGLFENAGSSTFNLYTEYKRGMPRLSSTLSISPDVIICLFPDTFLHLQPLESHLVVWEHYVSPGKEPSHYLSEHILMDGFSESEISSLPLPRLPCLLVGYAKRYIAHGDDMAMIAAEQLVDGMNVDESWCAKHLLGESQDVVALIGRLVKGKAHRLDHFAGCLVTGYIKDLEQAKLVRTIPGYE